MAIAVELGRQKIIMSRFNSCAGNGVLPQEIQAAKCMIENIFDPQTPSFKLMFGNVCNVLASAKRKIPDASAPVWKAMSADILAILTDAGYRLDPQTPFEHALLGSSEGEGYLSSHPFRPIGVIENRFTVAEANVARKLDALFYPLGMAYGMDFPSVVASLEPLDANGDAIRLPRIVDFEKFTLALAGNPAEAAINIAATGQKLVLETLLGDFPKEMAASLGARINALQKQA